MASIAAVLAMDNGGSAAGSGITLPGSMTVAGLSNNPASCSAVLSLASDGSVTATGLGNPTGWYAPVTAGIGALFDVMIDSISTVSGTRTLNGPASGVWTQLSSTVTWSVTAPSSTVEVDEFTYTLHIRRRVDSVVVRNTSVDHSATTSL